MDRSGQILVLLAGTVPVPRDQLPVILPDDVAFGSYLFARMLFLWRG